MPSFEVGEVLQNEAQIIIYPSGSYTWFRVYVRLTSSSSAVVYDEYFNDSGAFAIYVRGLSAGTSYTVNVAYGTTYSNAGNWMGAQVFTTSEAIDTTIMEIVCGTGVSAVDVEYINEYGVVDYTTVYGSEYLIVAQNTTQYVTAIYFEDGYEHPVTCSGQTSWQMTDANGSFLDASLWMGNTSKTFLFYATQSIDPGTGSVWIGSKCYKPYIYVNGSWREASAHIYLDGWIETKGS